MILMLLTTVHCMGHFVIILRTGLDSQCSKIMIYLVVMGQNSDKRLIFFSVSLKAKLPSFLRVIAIIRIVIGAEIADLIFK